MTTTSSRPGAGAFHEWPLVVFTTLAIMGAGLLAMPLVAWLALGARAPAASAVPWGTLLLGVGLVVSTAHLGRPLRAPLASLGIGRSRLSAEVVIAGIALMLGVASAVIPNVSPAMDFATAGAALALLVTLGLVYSLPGQQTWRGAVVWMPLTTGLGFSAVASAAMWSGPSVAIGVAAVGILAADTALLAVRRMSLAKRAPLAPRYPSVYARRDLILVSRLALIDILPACFLLAGLPLAAAGLLALGILVDRFGFYGLASQHTTEAEVGRVEQVIAS
jgi:anaerobic dimethyl sulfoxide reductase subunit C (anchor subunit)